MNDEEKMIEENLDYIDVTMLDYDEAMALFEKQNEKYLDLFYSDLIDANLKPKTISRHLDNVEFFLNTYLAGRQLEPMVSGVDYLHDFFGYFFIRKCMWSTPSSIKTTVASFKKFYKSMMEHECITKECYREIIDIFKDNLDDWMDECRIYNNGGYDLMDDLWRDDF